ncbi:MAG TPA: FHA domain-containing protein, partial [Anaerolineales bacterium]
GPNLRQLLDELIRQREWLSLNDAVRLVEQLCKTIEYVHQHDSLHWDINPANLMIKPEPAAGLPFRMVLIDLQLARLLEVLENDDDQPSAGTPAYMSPEQILGNAPDARSNIYSLGVLLYELVVGILPFPIKNVTEALLYYAQGDATPTPRSVRPDLPEGLEHVIMKALEKEPAERFGSAAEMGAALAAAMGDLTEIAEQEGAPDGNLFKKYQDSLAAPVSLEPASLLSEPVVGKTEMQSAYATERMDLPSVDQVGIQVQMEGRPPQTLTLDKDTVIIGRDRESDLILDDPRISRRHAQLTRDGSAYYVMDLNSANGTYLDNARIQAATPTIWRPQQELKIGGACLRLLVMGAIPTGTVLESYGAGSHTMLGAFDAEPIVITITPQQLTVEAGDSVTATLSLLNQGFDPDYFSLSLSGIPNDWVSSLPSHVELMPGEQKVIAFTLDIPRSHQSRAGRHAITLRATSQRETSQAADLMMTLTITPFSEFRAELSPRLQAGQVGRITISNLGNIQELFTVRLADITGELVFEPAQAQIRIPEGQTGFVEFRAGESQLRLLGGQKTHTVSAVVSTPSAEPQALHGELMSPAFLPAWVLPTTLLLCLFTAGTAAMIFAILNRSATLTVVKNGEGKVTSSPVGIDCGSICEYNFDNNDTVTLSAEPTSTYTFGGWSG